MNVLQNMNLFQELVRCDSNIYTWCYDTNGRLLESNCPEEALLSTAFSILGCKDRLMAHWQERDTPVTLGSSLGLMWGAAFEKQNGKPYRTWLLGPFFYTDVSMKSIEDGFHTYLDVEVSISWKRQFIKILYQIPTLPYIVHSRYLLMLHYCLTGESLTISDIGNSVATGRPEQFLVPTQRDRHKVWAAEQTLLQMVRSGDLDYKDALNTSQMLSSGVPIQSKDPLRQGKISIIVFCSIVCRAAIEGGLSPEEAYALGDAYIQSAEDATTIDDLMAIPYTMYDDFVHRVHHLHSNPKLSIPVQKCVDYINMHLHERIRATDLAKIAGYGEYYLTQKFCEETGYSFNDYVKAAKIERAKLLLQNTNQSVQEIADTLGFSTRSHFSQSFKQITGLSPAAYRSGLLPK